MNELVWLLFLFALLAMVIVVAGNYMAKAAEVIGERTGMGGSLAGLILLAAATSLPEFAINVNAVRLPDSASGVDLAMGNVLGSSLFNLLILGVIDLVVRSEQRMFSSLSAAHALSALVSVGLTAIVLMFILLDREKTSLPLQLFHVGLGPILCGVFYFFSIRLIYLDQQMAHRMADEEQAASEPEEPTMSLMVAVTVYLATAVAIFVAAAYLAPVADRFAQITGLGGTFVGSTLLALTTSLPELVTTIAAVRIGASDMAIGNIFGSNTFNIVILLPVDAFYTDGSLLAAASLVHAITAAAVILLTCVAMMSILYRAEKRYWIIEPDALLVVLLALAALWGIYELTRTEAEPNAEREAAALLRGERARPRFEHRELLREVIFLGPQRRLEEAGQLDQQAVLAVALGQVGEAGQVDHQRRRQERVAALPGELHDHRCAEKTLEVDVVPGCFPVSHAVNILDGDQRLRRIAEDFS